MVYVDTRALTQINRLLSEGSQVLILCPNGVTATEWQRKVKYLPQYSSELCKVKMSIVYKHPTIISKNLVLIYPDFKTNSLTNKAKNGIS